ncbi:hypothetical protein CTAYLR_000690 [Chrysophaeum taylorii]|uniref:N-acetyltransferase ESCO acetyl-transferase domain-containing protein n=1 Tax=Chrysophaeum taylorii TaxID=2483200 RepID=A0AAD7U8Q6_9STRA|nr:hypothetical protein CTAYLR_000690 [Chrysophaeum taylorii]
MACFLNPETKTTRKRRKLCTTKGTQLVLSHPRWRECKRCGLECLCAPVPIRWKSHRVAKNVFRVKPADDAKYWDKVRQVARRVDRDLGGCGNNDDAHAFLLVEDGVCVALIFAEALDDAATSDIIKVGVRKIWVHAASRRTGLATALLDALRASFFFATKLPKTALAFTHLTDDGTAFLASYLDTPPVVYSP